MHRVLIALFCIVFVVGINGAWLELPTTVNEDAIEMARLIDEFWSLKPAIFEKIEPLIYCQVIDQCCENEHRSQAASLFVLFERGRRDDGQFLRVINACVNSTALHNTNQWCPSYQKAIISSWVVQVNPDVIKYNSMVRKYVKNAEKILSGIESSCNNEEIHAFMCLSGKKLMETCVAKALQGINNDNGYKAYRKYLAKAKQALIDMNQGLSQLFIENTNTN